MSYYFKINKLKKKEEIKVKYFFTQWREKLAQHRKEKKGNKIIILIDIYIIFHNQ